MEDTKITIIYTYFGQTERLPGIVAEKHPKCRVVVVDDCSSEPLEAFKGIDVYRITDNITWNQPGARNLGFQESDGWIVCADIDHLVTKENVDELLKMKKEKGTVYYLGREDNDSFNIFLIHKEDFEKVGGYDEDFCGNYGYDDILFLNHCERTLKVVGKREIKVKVFTESASKLTRDTDYNRALLKEKAHSRRNNGRRIRFNWKKL